MNNRNVLILLLLVSFGSGLLGGYISSLFVAEEHNIIQAKEFRLVDAQGDHLTSIALMELAGETVAVFKDPNGKMIWKVPPPGLMLNP